MITLLLIIFTFFILYIPFIPFLLGNIHLFIKYAFIDLFNYFKYKKYNNFMGYGNIYLFSASGSQVFGSGKTASLVNEVFKTYYKYNNKMVYDEDLKEFVMQKIHIISNIELYGVDYIPFNSVNQFIDIDKYNFGSQDITLFVLDESGAIFNSREFKNNISTDMLNRLVQSRKNKCCLYMTSQRFNFTDKLLREITCIVYECHKKWRIVRNVAYNPLDLEYALNPKLVKPQFTKYWFATNESFKRYNTFQLVEKLNKEYTPLTDEEILLRRGSTDGSIDNLTNKRKKFFNRKNA